MTLSRLECIAIDILENNKNFSSTNSEIEIRKIRLQTSITLLSFACTVYEEWQAVV